MILGHLLDVLDNKVIDGDATIDIKGISYDSRKVEKGFLFAAIKGFAADGHDFIAQAVQRGAAAVLVERAIPVPPDIRRVLVGDTRLAMALLSSHFYGNPSQKLNLIGVTGTNGKTTTSCLIAEIMKHSGRRVGLIGTIANKIGERELPVSHTTPESADLQSLFFEMVQEGMDTAVMEVSSHALSLKRVAGCEFNGAVFTNLTQDHLDFHGDMEGYLAAKALLFKEMGQGNKPGPKFAVINADDGAASSILAAAGVPVITYGIINNADVMARDIKLGFRGASFRVTGNLGELQLSIRLTGMFNVYNALAACAVGLAAGVPKQLVAAALETVKGVPGRFELVERGQDFAVIVDYAHTPDGLKKVLNTAAEISTGRVISVFGCGGDRDRTKRPLMGGIAARHSDLPILTSDNPRTEDPLQIIDEVEKGILEFLKPGSYLVLPDRREAINRAIKEAKPGDVVLIAGKGHEDYQILGTKKIHFDDRQEAARALELRLGI